MASVSPELMTVFNEALEKVDDAERAAYLEQACGGDADLRRRVEALLGAHHGAGRFLDLDPTDAPRQSASQSAPTRDHATGDGQEGMIIAGRYTLLEKIGEGGMGEVWVARQSEPVKRKVALKLIKAGMDSRAVVRRFEQERQALALMDHPNIARVLDGGLTPGGQPFFVMELVNGLEVTKFCDEARLTPRERLELFVPICQAVQHAHHKGIVHRDLKPANILVTIIDGRPVPKVIDFGVAKAMAGRLTDESLSTQFGAVVGTLEYMSPEQAAFSGDDIDTRADIYSLGVILYELLTGLRPIDADRLRRAALPEMVRIIREEEPTRPSTRLSTDQSLPSLAALRQTEPRRLMALLRGELDWVVMKCLEKRRDRRYDTANALARDVQRYLADEAVEARPPSASYRLAKLVRRHKVALATTGVVAAALVFGTVLSTWQALRASRAETVALHAERAAVVERDEATARRAEAEAARNHLRRTLYAADMGLIQAAWEGGRHREIIRLLEREKAENPDFLGFEWNYWMRQSHQAARTVALPRKQWTYFPAFSGDGSRFVGVSGRVPVKSKGRALSYQVDQWNVWDVASGRVVASIAVPEGDTNYAHLNRDGSRLATAMRIDDDASGTHEHLLMVVETATGRKIVRRSLQHSLYSVEFSPEGRRLGAIVSPHEAEEKYGPGHALVVWDAQTGAEVRAIPGTFPRDGSRFAFSPDGKRVAAMIQAGGNSSQRDVKLWEVDSGREIATFPPAGPIDAAALSFSPDGKMLAAVADYPTGNVLHLWDTATSRSRFLIPLRSQGIRTSPVFSPDGRQIASVFNGLQVGVWDLAVGKQLAVYQDDISDADALSYGRNGHDLLAADLYGSVKIWDAPESSNDQAPDADGRVSVLTVSPDGRWIAGVVRPKATTPWGNTPIVKLWDVKGRLVRSFGRSVLARDGEIEVGWPGWSPRGDRIVFATTRFLRSAAPAKSTAEEVGGALTVWDLEGNELFHLEEQGVFFNGPSLGPEGGRVAAIRARALDSRRIAEAKVWDLTTGQVVTTIPECTYAVLDPQGRRLAGFARSADESWRAAVWDAATGAELIRLELPDPRPGAGIDIDAMSLAFSSDEQRLAGSIAFRNPKANYEAARSILAVWDVASGKLKQVGQGEVGTLAFSPDGSRIAGVYGSTTAEVGLWDAETGRQVLALKGHGANSRSAYSGIAFTPDGHQIVSAVTRGRLASGPRDQLEIKIWDATPWTSTP